MPFFNVKNITRIKLHTFFVIIGKFCSILSQGVWLVLEREEVDVCTLQWRKENRRRVFKEIKIKFTCKASNKRWKVRPLHKALLTTEKLVIEGAFCMWKNNILTMRIAFYFVIFLYNEIFHYKNNSHYKYFNRIWLIVYTHDLNVCGGLQWERPWVAMLNIISF